MLASLTLCVTAEWPASVLARSQPADLLARVREHVARFQQEAPSLVAREDYTQTVSPKRLGNPEERNLVSELVMVRLPERAGWISFRDVLEVDGRKVNDRERRLIELLQTPDASSLQQARKLAAESARFNIGRLTRTMNVPDLALEFLSSRHAHRISFSAPERARIDGIQTMAIRFKEHTGPSILRNSLGGDLLIDGRVWVDAESAALVRTDLILRDRSTVGSCTVDFAIDQRLAIRVPAKMTERYELTSETILGLARYSDYRKFAVSTSEKVGKPKGW